ncbi:MAG: glutamyl-tRNA(Gln) amidotransferase subunit [Thermomicrobiales bacterium]|nr:glutamyl-tRNA(Gln) amidotransferase subunit [Thermomicrobiales bacterium]
MTESIAYLSASDLRDLYRAKTLSPVEVTRAILDRIEGLNPALNAFTVVTGELALNQARAAERAYAAGDAPPLAGVPTSIKDLTPTRGIATARGSLIDVGWIPEDDAPVVERLYTAGAVMLGKTNTPELGWKGDSGNRVFGPSFNPWNLQKTPGGSSGGAAAAVAAGLGPLAQGSDGAGSIRIPAAFCGIFGLKQSFGLVPQYPPSAVGDLSHLGPMTRTVRDAAIMLNAMAGADNRDRLSWSSGIDYERNLDAGVRGLRVAWSPTLGYAKVANDVLENAERAAMVFRELGCEVELADPRLPDPANILDVMWSGSLAGYFVERIDEVRHLLDPGLLLVVDRAASLSAPDMAHALQQRNTYYTGMRQFMDLQGYDLLLTPTLPVTAFTAGLDEPDGWQRATLAPLDWTPFTFPFNLTGQPAATVPCGLDGNGLPVGLQIVGRWRDDSTVLRAAAAFEAAMPWTDLRPTLDSPDDLVR